MGEECGEGAGIMRAIPPLPANYEELTPAERRAVREEYVRRQKGLCFHCQNPLTGPASDIIELLWVDESLFPPNFFVWPVHLHHDHKTGKTLGAVHCKCNAVLWQYNGE